MSAKRHDRTLSRQTALQILYAAEINATTPKQIIDDGLIIEDCNKIDSYTLRLLDGIQTYQSEIDGLLSDASNNWTISRMPLVDIAVMRIATYEMLYVDEVPTSVSINEAVDLAKAFGGEDDSHRFVNGVLGWVAKKIAGTLTDADQATIQHLYDERQQSIGPKMVVGSVKD